LIAILLIFSFLPIKGNTKLMIVQSGSMEPTIKTGSVLIVKPVSDYVVGDIITFQKKGERVSTTHRIAGIKEENGNILYETKGDANGGFDREGPFKSEVIGKVLFSVPYIGYVMNFIEQPLGFILIVGIPSLLIIIGEIKKIYVETKKNKKS